MKTGLRRSRRAASPSAPASSPTSCAWPRRSAAACPCGAIGGTAEIMDAHRRRHATSRSARSTATRSRWPRPRRRCSRSLTPDAYAAPRRPARGAASSGASDMLGRYRLPGYVQCVRGQGRGRLLADALRDYRDFCGYDDRWGHAHWLYQHNGGVFLPPWGKCEQWTMSVQHSPADVERRRRQPRALRPRPSGADGPIRPTSVTVTRSGTGRWPGPSSQHRSRRPHERRAGPVAVVSRPYTADPVAAGTTSGRPSSTDSCRRDARTYRRASTVYARPRSAVEHHDVAGGRSKPNVLRRPAPSPRPAGGRRRLTNMSVSGGTGSTVTAYGPIPPTKLRTSTVYVPVCGSWLASTVGQTNGAVDSCVIRRRRDGRSRCSPRTPRTRPGRRCRRPRR